MIHIDYQDKRPIYEQVVEKIQTLIVKGAFEKDMKLPSVRALAIELSINPNTIQRAYAELESNGFIYTVKGRGNFVSAKENYMDNERDLALQQVRKAAKQAMQLDIEENVVQKIVAKCYAGEENQ
ncbi:MAG: GntR family transcriptional regulator [Lachnospiraceae bacterium]|nr:GntR family transcriptional regulator [Lachnospiraceae bacterium]